MPGETILLVPSPDYARALLDGDACGGAVPRVWRIVDGCPWIPGPPPPNCSNAPVDGLEEALVLAHRGVPLPIGCDRAARVLAIRDGLEAQYGCVFRREHRWEGGAWYMLVAHCGPTEGASADPSRWYASESIERLMSVEADAILPELADGADEPLALGRICAVRGIGRLVVVPA